MSEEPLSVDEVDVVRAPGFESGGFTVEDLCPGVNVIHGPNAAGKTTMARSIQWLLWPDGAAERAEVIGGLAIDGEQWRVDFDRGRAEYQRDGQEANRPSLPPSDQRDRYVLSLHELLQHETRDETFAQAILRESAGGYDLSAAIEELDFDDSPTHTQKGEVRDAKSAVDAWREAKREMEELQDEQRRLPGLKRGLEEAEEAGQRVDLLEQAIDYAEARNELESAEAELAEFPHILHEIDGGEAESVEKLDGQIEEWEEKKADASTALQKAEEKLAEADLPEYGVPDGFIDQVKQHRDELESLESRKRDREGSLADREEQRDSALEDIPVDVDEGDLSELDAEGWKNISTFAKEAEAVNAEREVRETVVRWLTDDEELEHERSTLDRGSQALEQWLAHPSTQTSEVTSPLRVTDIVFAGLLALAGLALGWLVQPVGYAFVLVAAILLWYVNRSASPDADDDSDQAAHRNAFEGLGLDRPESWTEDAVRERLWELYDAVAAHRIAEERGQQRQALLSDVDELEEREEALEERRQELWESLGAAPETSDIELVATTKAISRWQEAHGRVLGLREEIDAIEGEIDSTRSTLVEELAPYGYEEIDDAAEATGHIRNLESRLRDHDEATKAISDAEAIIDEAESKIEGFREERTEIFEELDLDPNDFEELQSLCEQADEFEEVVSAHEKAKHLAASEEEDLEAMPGFEPDLKEREVSALEQEKADAEETASAYDELNTEITEIEKDIRDARSDNRVEDALTERERAFDELADELDSDYDSMVGHALAEHVREATTDASRPAVFEQAREVLARISRGRYRLDLDDGDETFRAYDTVKERGFALDELSSATRLQVLLAVRIAFVERHEQGTKLPILLDETLANTDDGKAEVIIDSMLELAREGRQLFYFTAQGDEVARWLSAIEADGDVEHTTIDLAEVQDLDRHVEVPELDEIADRPTPPPDPEAHDHDSYGEAIDVPPFDPRRGAGTAHLWYVVEDLELLHQLLGLGIERWGQLENLFSTGGSQAIVDDHDRFEVVECNGSALEEFVRSWRKGRGKRVDRDALEDSGAVSENFIDRVTELADELNGDGERIIEALRDGQVNRFRRDNMDELEAYFEENGYIESIDPLEPEQIRVRLIDCLVRHDVPREEARERGLRLLDRLAAFSSS